jgi:dihydrofolate reductase
MGKVIFDVSMSLDGFITGANVRPEAGLGDGGERLHEWVFDNPSPPNRKIMEAYSTFGATIAGRVTYDLSIPYWGADGPTGAVRTPVVIVSHSVPGDVPEGGVYTFVGSVDAALKAARELAGDKDISISGADLARQFLSRGLIDEIAIHVVPVLFGSGTRLFENLAGEHISLEMIEVIPTAEVIHLRYRVPR